MSEEYSEATASYDPAESVEQNAEDNENQNPEEKHPEEEQSYSQEKGQAKVFERLQDGNIKFPIGFGADDLRIFLEGIEVPPEFNTETIETYYQECLNLIKEDLAPEPETPGEDEDSLILNEDFIKQRLSDLQPVEGEHLAFALTSFSVAEAEISDISALSSFTALLYISLKTNLISSVACLSGLPRLRELNLAENRLISFADIELPSLETLNLAQNKFCSISNLKLPKLKKLILSQNKIYFITPGAFDMCGELETLELQENKIKFLKEGAFRGLKSIKSIKLSQNSLTEIAEKVFDETTSLNSLNLAENPIEKIGGLCSISSLKSVDLSQTGVPDFEAIKGITALKNLSSISFEGAPIQSGETYKSDMILLMPWLEVIDSEPIQFSDRQDAMNLQEERKAEEERLRKEKEQEEAAAKEAEEEKAEDATEKENASGADETETAGSYTYESEK